MEEIRALSFKQPFADLIVFANKIETRTWQTSYRGKVLICASKGEYNPLEMQEIAGDLEIDIFKAYRNMQVDGHSKKLHGHAIGIATLVDCRPMTKDDEPRCFVKYKPGLYCHVYENVRPIISFEWKGTQGWKKLTQTDFNKIQFL